MKTKEEQLQDLAKSLATIDCPLREQATQPVFGEGDPNAKILFIGEAPGKNEDEEGRPFVGTAGKMLNSWLKEIGLERNDVYIANIEKFRPPDNRDPKQEEIQACFPILENQIKIIEPDIIVTLGRHALQRMLEWEKGESIKTPSMGNYHGKTIVGSRYDCKYLPVYHPAAILYNRSLETKMQSAFRLLSKMTDTSSSPTTPPPGDVIKP